MITEHINKVITEREKTTRRHWMKLRDAPEVTKQLQRQFAVDADVLIIVFDHKAPKEELIRAGAQLVLDILKEPT